MKTLSRISTLALSVVAANSAIASTPVLEEVTVTAQKREQSLQDVPLTVNVLSGQVIEDFEVDDLFEVASLVPGMVLSRAADDGIGLTFRGIGTPARPQAFDQSVALFVDGMFLGKGRMYSLAFFDTERIEFIKGTQSTLLGKNTSLGAISVVTRKPGMNLAGRVALGAELEHGGVLFDGAVDVPVNEDLSLRGALHYVDKDGWVKSTATGLEGPADEDLGFRLTGVYTPGKDADIAFSYQYNNSYRLGNATQLVYPEGSTLPSSTESSEGKLDDTNSQFTSLGEDGDCFHETIAHFVNVTANIGLDQHLVTSVSSFATYELEFVDDFDISARDSVNFLRDEDYTQFSQEVRITSTSDGNLEYIAGLFYFYSDWDSEENQLWNVAELAGVDVGAPVNGIFYGPFANDFSQKTSSVSAFVSGTLHLSDTLSLAGGLRYTYEDKEVKFGRRALPPLTFWNLIANPSFEEQALDFDDSIIGGNITLQYQPGNDINLYASYGRGGKTGGFVETNTVPTGNPDLEAFIDSEITDTLEMGGKFTLLDNRLSLNTALFYTKIDDFQETYFTGAAFVTESTEVESRGGEFELQYVLSDTTSLMTAWTYADAEDTVINMTPAQSPQWSGYLGASFSGQWKNGLGWTAAAYVRHRSEMFNQRFESYPSQERTTLDMTLSLLSDNDSWSLTLVGKNLTNEETADFSSPVPDGFLNGTPGISAQSVAELRSVILKGAYRF